MRGWQSCHPNTPLPGWLWCCSNLCLSFPHCPLAYSGHRNVLAFQTDPFAEFCPTESFTEMDTNQAFIPDRFSEQPSHHRHASAYYIPSSYLSRGFCASINPIAQGLESSFPYSGVQAGYSASGPLAPLRLAAYLGSSLSALLYYPFQSSYILLPRERELSTSSPQMGSLSFLWKQALGFISN